MSDLISRKEALSLLTNLQLNGGDLADAKRFVAVMPTAYDPDKVVEQLEDCKTKRYVSGITHNPYEFGACHAMDDAIEIVRKGGNV